MLYEWIFTAVNRSNTDRTCKCVSIHLGTQAISECVIIHDWDDFETGYFPNPQLLRPHAAANTHNRDHITEKNDGQITSVRHRPELAAASRLQTLMGKIYGLIGTKQKEFYEKIRPRASQWP